MIARSRPSVWRWLTLFWSIYRDRRSPAAVKILPVLALLYMLFPIDAIPDFIPVLGQADDIMVLVTMLLGAFNMIPKDLYREHRERVKVQVE